MNPYHCPLCDEEIDPARAEDENYSRPMGTLEGPRRAHRECLLRTVLGGIGHLENHQHWCSEMHDPDGGRTYRQSALEVDAWVHAHGTSQDPS